MNQIEFTMKKDIAILFLAHAGVSQGKLWEAWRNSNPRRKNHIHFFVHTGGNSIIDDSFVQKYDIDGKVKTRWGDDSLVLAYQEGLRHILTHGSESIRIIHFVSGMDIPIQTVERVFRESKTRFRKISDESNTQRLLFRIPKKSKAKLYISASDFVSHQQWHSISRKHAAIIADFDFSLFAPWDFLFGDLGKDLKAKRLAIPDEYYVGTVLKASVDWKKEVIFSDRVYTDANWNLNDENTTGPETYSDFDTPKAGWSLRDVLTTSDESIMNNALWFRKVDKNVDFREEKSILLWQSKE